MALIKIYDSEMIGDGITDSFKKYFSYLAINDDGIIETRKDSLISAGINEYYISGYQTLGSIEISSNPLTNMPQIIEKVRINFSSVLPNVFDPLDPQPAQSEIIDSNIIDDLLNFDQYNSYHFTSVNIPDFDENPLSFSNILGDNYSHYNYKMRQYEDATISLNERQLPNFMIGLYRDYANSSFLYQNIVEEANSYYNYNGQFNMSQHDMVQRYTGINEFNFDDQTYDYSFNSSSADSNYFYKFSQLEDQGSLGYSAQNNHVFITFNYNEAETRKTVNAPYYVKIKIPKTVSYDQTSYTSPINNTSIRDFVKENFGDKLLENVLISSFKNAEQSLRSFVSVSPNEISEQQVKIYDLPTFLEQFDLNYFTDSTSTYLRRASHFYDFSNQNTYNQFLFQMTEVIFDLQEEFTNKVFNMTFDELIDNNSKCYSEILGYKIEKFGNGDQPIQTFYILNKDKSIIDTQIVIDKNYGYTISAMVIIGGVRYKYISTAGVLQSSIDVQYIKEPSIKVAEVPLKTFQTKIVEPPPLQPHVTFTNEQNTKNLVKIVVENSKGNMFQELIKDKNIDLINTIDSEYEQNLNIMHGGGNYPFSSRTYGGLFDIYRLEEEPTSMADFEGNLLQSVEALTDSQGTYLSSIMYSDYIKHNTDYYYLIRALTYRGNPGLSSPIYKIRLIEDADEVILNMTTVSVSPKELITFENNMRKYLQIIPNKSQVLVDSRNLNYNIEPSQPSNLDKLKLGSAINEDSLWDYGTDHKYFKIRLESKKTGKKIDLNIKFKFSKPTSN